MIRRPLRTLLILMGLAVFTIGGFATSGANFVAQVSSAPNTFTAYPDWVAPVVSINAPADGARIATAAPAISGVAGVLAGDLAPVTVRIYAGTTASGPVLRSVTVNRNASTGAWTATPTALADGTYTARAQQDDSFLNSGFSHPVSFTIDTVAPAPAITVPAAGATVGAAPAISGTAGNAIGDSNTLTVSVYAGGTATGTPVRTLTATRSGTAWSVATTPALTNGTYTARAAQADDVGHTGLSAARTFVVDATPPAPTILQPTAGQWLTTQSPTISGRAGTATGDSTTVTVNLYAGAVATGVPVRTQTTTRTGNAWTLVVSPSLADGQYTAQAVQSDAVGNVGSSAGRTFNVDTTTPVVSITTPTAGQRTLARPPISGLAGIVAGDSATVTVRIYSGASTAGTLVQTRTATRNATTGAWTLTPNTLADGQYTAQATQTDSAGHSGTSAPVSFVTDATAPAGVAITAPTASQWLTTSTPTLSGTAGNAAGDDPTLTVSVYSGAAATGVPVQVLTAARTGTAWSVAVSPALADGQYTAVARQADASGNATTSAARTFNIDTTTPVVSISTPTSGQRTAPQPPISGVAGILSADSATVTVRIYAGPDTSGTLVQTRTATRNATTGAWTTTPTTLADGTYTVQAMQLDTAGHSGTSAAITFIADGTPPAGVAVSSPTAGQWLTASSPTFTGTAGNAAGDASTLTVSLYSGAAASGVPIQVLTATRAGTAWSVPVSAALTDGQYTVVARQADASGNATNSVARTFNVDTTTPVVSISAPTAGQLTIARPPISGVAGIATGDSATVTARIYSGASTAGTLVQTLTATRNASTGAWTVTPATLAGGTYTVQATQLDSAAHGGTSAAITFTTDSVVPVAQSISAVNGGGVAGHLDSGDSVVFTFSEAIAPASLLTGWSGLAPAAVHAKFLTGGASDGLTLLNASNTATLGLAGGSVSTSGINLGADFVSATVNFSATMALSGDRRTVTITLGTPDTPAAIRPAGTPARNMAWTRNTAVRDDAGNQVAAGTTTETDNDRDF